jgi:hypothetical protein
MTPHPTLEPSLLIALAATAAAQAATVSWNYDRFGTVSGSAVAGVVPVANWNNSWPSNPTTDLVDDSGAGTTIDLSYTSFNTWSIQGSDPGLDADGSSNSRLLNGYLNAGPAGWGPPVTASSITLSQISYANYNIIIYFSADAAGREGQVSNGATTYYFSSLGAPSIAGANATLTQTNSTSNSDYAGANYAVFTGLSGASQTLTVQMRDNDEWGGIAGFQVVAVPEPSAALLGGLGLLALLRRRRG